MKILIDTTSPDFFMSLISNGHTLAFIHEKNLVKKADALPGALAQLLQKGNIALKDVKKFYVTTGPGSFMGCRSGLVFAKAICQVLQITLLHASTFMLISGNAPGIYFIDAKGASSYQAIVAPNSLRLLLTSAHLPSAIDYGALIANPEVYLALFEVCDDLLALSPTYLKNPRIGGE